MFGMGLQALAAEMEAKRTYKSSVDIAVEYIMHTFRATDLSVRMKAIEALNDTLNAKVFCMANEEEKEILFKQWSKV